MFWVMYKRRKKKHRKVKRNSSVRKSPNPTHNATRSGVDVTKKVEKHTKKSSKDPHIRHAKRENFGKEKIQPIKGGM
jgi:hypothetical protein